MNIIIIFNGLGNQMSQYAFYIQKKQLSSSTRFLIMCKEHSGLELNKVFGIDCHENEISPLLKLLFKICITQKSKFLTSPLKKILHLMRCHLINENMDYCFHPEYLKGSEGLTFYFGGWHNEQYFIKMKEQIFNTFRFASVNDEENLSIIQNIKTVNSISLHVRRGDYYSDKVSYEFYGKVCNEDYFEKAISVIEDDVENPVFFIFSNDMEWVKTNLKIKRAVYVTINHGKNSWKDMYLMSLCRHNIVSNSSFSWWGAWLNQNPHKKVICPSKFLNNDKETNVYPESWVRIPV